VGSLVESQAASKASMHTAVVVALAAVIVLYAVSSAYKVGKGDGYEEGFKAGSKIENQRIQNWRKYEREI
jgi:hypothetical protein